MASIRKRNRKDRIQLAFDLDAILKELENSFITKLTGYFKRLTNKLLKKIEDIPALKKALNTVDKTDINQLKTLIKGYYKKVGKATIKQTNKEIAELSGKRSSLILPQLNEGLRYRSEQLAKKQLKDFNDTVKEKINQGEGTKKAKSELIKDIKKAQKAYAVRHITIVSRMESVTVANQQRLEAFKKSKIIKGVQFLAVLDNRTTKICQSRHNMVLRLDDPLLPNFTPPCHFGCRSLLSGVTIFEKNLDYTDLKDLQSVPEKDFGKSKDVL